MDELRVKTLSLAAEARIIRKMERRLRNKWRDGRERTQDQLYSLHFRYEQLRNHRVHIVRPEARATNLAVGFLRGRTYRQIEPTAITKPNWQAVQRMVGKYGKSISLDELAKWSAVPLDIVSTV